MSPISDLGLVVKLQEKGKRCAYALIMANFNSRYPTQRQNSNAISSPVTKPTFSIEEWEKKATLDEVELRSVLDLQSASIARPLPSHVRFLTHYSSIYSDSQYYRILLLIHRGLQRHFQNKKPPFLLLGLEHRK